MGCALRAIANSDSVCFLANQSYDIRDRIDRPQRVRHVIECDDLRALIEQSAQKLQIDPAVRRELADSELRALFPGEHLPGDEVRVMIERSHDYLITGGDIRLAP